ncbi:colicin D domain-containing protein [uncultured Tenacibaculum sp.]|uniref:colicin D domain-containing protein n=1 Tax=uncultured Tenacibaculum sp. TaxID=174713 RepID=UPI0026323D70|nr:colicin D domain-containing protein [uncultured Tenacibaculum sp.]
MFTTSQRLAVAGEKVIHYVNPNSALNVMTKLDGTFISGWKLGEEQLKKVLTRGSL